VPPGFPVEVLGLDGAPGAGDEFNIVEDENAAATIAEHRRTKTREKDLIAGTKKLSLEDLLAKGKKDEAKVLKVIVKADVQGSVEALKNALTKLATPKVTVDVIHSGVGNVTESDVMLGAASKALIVGFNTKSESKADESASSEGVEIKHYSIIYEALDDVKLAMEGLLEAIIRERVLGHAKVQALFNVPKLGTIAGSAVTDGKVTRTSFVRLLRDSNPIFTGRIASLRRFKDVGKEVGDNDAWQRALVGVTAVANDRSFVNEVLDKVVRDVESLGVADLVGREMELETYSEMHERPDKPMLDEPTKVPASEEEAAREE